MKLPKKQNFSKKPKTHSSLQGRFDNIEIQSLTHQGQGVTKINQKAVFVEGALPTEILDIKISQDLAHYAHAKPVKWHQYAADRTQPNCQYYGVCGGCDLQHLSVDSQVFWKQQNLLDQLNKTLDCRTLQVESSVSDQPLGYRRRARLFLTKDPKSKQACLGFKQAQSDRVVDIEHCPILTHALNQTVQTARFDLLPLASRQLREIHLAEADNGTWLCSDLLNQSPQNEPYPFYTLGNLTLAFDPKGFIQVNARINKSLVEQMLNWLQPKPTDKYLDLFCGVGNFSLPLAQIAAEVTGVEGNPEAVKLARHNAQINLLSNTSFMTHDLFTDNQHQAWWKKGYNAIVLDPGRLGAKLLCEQLGELGANKILYISCHSDTLIRDLKALEQQSYRLKRIQLFEMFPQTHHYETMALLERC